MIFLVYLFVLFALIKLLIVLLNYCQKPFLQPSFNKAGDKISVLVPARNEAGRISGLLNSIRKDSYQNLEVIVLDDHSVDKTSRIVRDFMDQAPWVRLIPGKPLPNGWLGKNFACHQLAMEAEGDLLIFLDADVEVSEGFFSSVVGAVHSAGADMISVFNDQEMITLGEKITVPMMHYILLTMLPLKSVRTSARAEVAAASGQCMIFRKQNYDAELWHSKVKSVVTEDIEIFKLAKRKGYKPHALLGNGLIKCRMYTSFADSLNGFSKNFLAGFGNSILLMSIYLFLEGLIFIPLFYQDHFWLLILGLSFTLIGKSLVSVLSRQHVVMNVILHPVQLIGLIIISVFSIYKKITKTNRWKGRSIDLQSA